MTLFIKIKKDDKPDTDVLATICIGLVLFECKLLNKILNSLFLVYQIEFVGDLFGWCLGNEADDDVCCNSHQECGKKFIDSPGAAERADSVFPDKYHGTAADHSCQGSLPVGTSPE